MGCRFAGHILKSPLKTTLGLFKKDGPNLRKKKAALLSGGITTSTPRSKPGQMNVFDMSLSPAKKNRPGKDVTRDALDEFRGLMEDRDEGANAEGRLDGSEVDSVEEEDSEDWDVDTTFAKLLEQEYHPFSVFLQRIYPCFTVLIALHFLTF